MQRDDDMASPVVVYVAVWSLRETVVPPFVRDARLADWTAVPVVVPERAVTRRVVVGVAARAVVDLFVALRAASMCLCGPPHGVWWWRLRSWHCALNRRRTMWPHGQWRLRSWRAVEPRCGLWCRLIWCASKH